MNKRLEDLYFRSPVWLQNIAVSMLGMKLYMERHGKSAGFFEQKLKQSVSFTGEQLMEVQSSRFVLLARSAIQEAPHYMDWAKKHRVTANDIRSVEDLKLFPVLSKEQVREAPHRFVLGGEASVRKLIKLHTSGTTGSPMSVYCSGEDRTHHYAFFSRLRESFGLDRRSKRATLFGRIILRSDQSAPPFWRYDAIGRNLLMSSYHLGEGNLEHYFRKLQHYAPDEIFAYPSSIVPIAQYIINKGLPKLPLKLVMTTAEPLFPYQVEAIQNAFDAPVVNQYGCTEMAFFASQQVGQPMKLAPEHGIAEVLLPSGEISDCGEGEFIATGLVNKSMPLIRYSVGDRISLSPLNIDLEGSHAYSQIDSFTGRSDDLIYKKDGTPVGRLDPVFKGEFNIKAAQIIQLQSGDIKMIVEPEKTFSEESGQALITELRKRVGEGLSISLVTSQLIQKSSNGKFKAVISEYEC